MEIETKIKISYETTLGDDFDDNTDKKTIKELIEQHIEDYCKEHKINRNNIKIIK